MAVGDTPHLVYIKNTLLAEFRLIQEAKGYYSNVQEASFPDFSPLDLDRLFSSSECPALYGWFVKQGQGVVEYSLTEHYPEVQVEVVGVVKSLNVQDDLYALHEDTRRVMLSNARRVYPGQANPPYVAVNTREGPMGTDFMVEKVNDDESIGVFASSWFIAYMTRLTEKT